MIEALPFTPVRNTNVAGSPAFCSTRVIGNVSSSNVHDGVVVGESASADPPLSDLITSIAQQVGQSIIDRLKGECGEGGVRGLQSQSSVGQSQSEPAYLNLTGAKLVLQPEVKEPPTFRGDGSDKNTVAEC